MDPRVPPPGFSAGVGGAGGGGGGGENRGALRIGSRVVIRDHMPSPLPGGSAGREHVRRRKRKYGGGWGLVLQALWEL